MLTKRLSGTVVGNVNKSSQSGENDGTAHVLNRMMSYLLNAGSNGMGSLPRTSPYMAINILATYTSNIP